MYPARNPRFAPPWLVLVAVLATLGLGCASLGLAASAESAPAPLRLVGTAGGVEYDQFIVEDHELFIRTADGAKQPVPRGMKWRLEGDLRANAEQIFFAPPYKISTRVAYPILASERVHSFATIWLERGWPWAEKETQDAVAVFVWLNDRRPVVIKPVPVRSFQEGSRDFSSLTAFELLGGAERGFPIILLWKEGRFIAARPWFSQAEDNEALLELYFGVPGTIDAAVRKIARVDVRSEKRGATFLHFAAGDGLTEPLCALLKHGASTEPADFFSERPIHEAAARNRGEVVRILRQNGARPARHGRARRNAFATAMRHGHLELAVELLDQKPRAEDVRWALGEAIVRVDQETIDELFRRGAGRHLRSLPVSIFRNVVALGDTALLSRLFAGNVEWSKGSLLLAAAYSGRVEMIDLLLSAGVPVDEAADDGSTALMVASWRGETDIVNRLVSAGADVNRNNVRRECAMFLARVAGRGSVIESLARHGVKYQPDLAWENAWLEHPPPPESFFHLGMAPIRATEHVDHPATPVGMDVLSEKVGSPDRDDFTTALSLTRMQSLAYLMPSGPPQYRVFSAEVGTIRAVRGDDLWATVTMIVEPYGRASFIQVIDASSDDVAFTARKAARSYMFEPGMKDGRPVRTRVVFAIAARVTR